MAALCYLWLAMSLGVALLTSMVLAVGLSRLQ